MQGVKSRNMWWELVQGWWLIGSGCWGSQHYQLHDSWWAFQGFCWGCKSCWGLQQHLQVKWLGTKASSSVGWNWYCAHGQLWGPSAGICGVAGTRAGSKDQGHLGATGSCRDPGCQHALSWLLVLATGVWQWRLVMIVGSGVQRFIVGVASFRLTLWHRQWQKTGPNLGPQTSVEALAVGVLFSGCTVSLWVCIWLGGMYVEIWRS